MYELATESGLPGGNVQELRAPRFFVQMAWENLRVDTDAIQYVREGKTIARVLPRGIIVPCVTYERMSNIHEIRDGELIAGSESADKDGRIQYGKYYSLAGFEADRLMNTENSSDRPNALVEIESLKGLAAVAYGREGSINSLFYPAGFEMPETNRALRAHLVERLAILTASAPAGIDPMHHRVIISVGKELIAAVDRAESVQASRLEFTHSCMRLQPKEEGFKRGYDLVDEEMLRRTGVPRIHEAQLKTAVVLEKLAGQASDNSTQELIQLQREQNDLLRQQLAQQNEQIQQLIAQNGGKKAPTPQAVKS